MNATPAHQPDPPAADRQWLVHCSPERTLVARRHGDTTTLVKIFEQGSLLEAEQEAELAITLAQPGVVTYTSAGLDPITTKPCVRMEFFEGSNLERKIADSGPLPSRLAAELILSLARVLADFHNTPRPLAPGGVVHRDIKPANVFLARDHNGEAAPVLIDLEHATARQPRRDLPGTAAGFTGGTHGYSAPECYAGAYPSPAFDVFGLGATLFYVLTGCSAYPQLDPTATAERVQLGCSRLSLLCGQPGVLRGLVADCLAIDPTRRPTSTQVIDLLQGFITAHGEGDAILDRALQAIQAGDDTAADAHLEAALTTPGHDDQRHHQLIQLASTRARLLTRIGGAPESELSDLLAAGDLAELARRIATDLPHVHSFLRRFPLHRDSLEQRKSVLSAGHRLLEHVLPEVAILKARTQFPAAHLLLDLTTLAARALAQVPGGLSLPTSDPGHLPGPLLRNPARILERSMRDVTNTEKVHEELIARLEAAEANLDLAAAGAVLNEVTAIYSGASQVAAQMRDRLHRLDFYVQRIGTPNRLLEQLAELLEVAGHDHQLATVTAFIQRCGEASIQGSGKRRAKGGVRGLLDTMDQLLEDFPHTHESSAPPATALREAMRAITKRAWEYLESASTKLQATPVPIRPVQNLLHRIDGIRLLEVFLDLPDRNRERLQDEIERVRLRFDQARTTRDNIARGAQEALDKGHFTTALYEMERAVEDSASEVADDPADPAMVKRLEEAKRRKREVEKAVVENHRLAARYVELIEDEDSRTTERLDLLQQRAKLLQVLIQTLGTDRGAHYQNDLRDVVLNLIQEQANHGERELDRAPTTAARADIAKATLDGLVATGAEPTVGQEIRGRTKRLISHWQHKCREIQAQLEQERQAAESVQRRQRRKAQIRVAIPLVLVTLLLGIYGFDVVYGQTITPPHLPQLTRSTERLQPSANGRLGFRAAAAHRELQRFAAGLDAASFAQHQESSGLRLAELAQRLATHLPTLSTTRPDQPGISAWTAQLIRDLLALDSALQTLAKRSHDRPQWLILHTGLIRFGQQAHAVGLRQLACQLTERQVFDTAVQPLASLRALTIPDQLAQIRSHLN